MIACAFAIIADMICFVQVDDLESQKECSNVPAELGPDASIFDIKIGRQRLLTSNFVAAMDSLVEFATFGNNAPYIVGQPKFVDNGILAMMYHRDVLVSAPFLSLALYRC